MLININNIVQKYGLPKGIIHIGAHLLEERNSYLNLGINNILWIEANPLIYDKIKGLTTNNSTGIERVFNLTVSNVDGKEYIFNITDNSQSSSILELEKHLSYYPDIHVIDKITTHSIRMDTFLNSLHDVDVSYFDFLNLDIQGAELLAIEGFGELINNFKYIYTEINTDYIYKNCALIHEIDNYLLKYNFVRRETKLTNFSWGDALYTKIRNLI